MRIGKTLAATLICSGALLGFAGTGYAGESLGVGAPINGPESVHMFSVTVQDLSGQPDSSGTFTIHQGLDHKLPMTVRNDGSYWAVVTGEKLSLDIKHPVHGYWTLDVMLPEDQGQANLNIEFTRSGPVATFEDLTPQSGRTDCVNIQPGDLDENEPCGSDTNGGCNMAVPAFTEVLCGDTWFGNGWAENGTRDTDWYRIVHTGGTLSATLTSEFSAYVFLLEGDFNNCTGVVVSAQGTSNDCAPAYVELTNLFPGTYCIWVGPTTFYNIPCGMDDNDYRLEVCSGEPTGACCYADGTCDDLLQADCNAAGGNFQGFFTDCATAYCPVLGPNDQCDGAIELVVPSTVMGSTEGATIDSEFPFCGTGITSPGIWYYVYGTGNGMTATTCGDFYDYDTKISVYCVSCDDPVCVGGNDDSCSGGASGLLSTVNWCSQYGALYLILVHGFGGAEGAFELSVFDDGMPCTADIVCLPQGACCLPDGTCVIDTEGGCANAGGAYQGDDTDCSGLPAFDGVITVEVFTDYWYGETSWELVDEFGNVVAERGSYPNRYTLFTDEVDVLNCGCYTFTIFDSYGDGICCSYGEGYYNVYFNGVLVATGGEFGLSETTSDIGDCTGCFQDVGACCLLDGSCIITTGTCCAYAGGGYQGPGTDCSGLPGADSVVQIEILTDRYGGETSWDLFDASGAVVASVGGGLANNTYYNWMIEAYGCECYTFVIYDSWGDGICCAYGEGYYTVSFNGMEVGSGGDFDDMETVGPFGGCTGCDANIGACCFSDGSCMITTGECCVYAGGIFVGAGTDCGTGFFPLLSENFNSGIPADWTVTDDAGAGWGWELNSVSGRPNYAGGDGTCATANSDYWYSYPYDTSLYTPLIDLTAAVGATLDFVAAYNYLGSGEGAEVYASGDGGTTWTNLLSWHEDHDAYGPGEEVQLDLSAFVGGMAQVRFRYYGDSWDWWFMVDNVVLTAELEGISPCKKMDIKPGSCPNAYNDAAQGYLPVSVCGTEDFDVTMIDTATLMLGRADGVGGLVAPTGWFRFGDTSTPFYGDWCDCHELYGDGITDLKLKFFRPDVTAALMLGEEAGGTCIPLVLYGMTLDGDPFIATDNITMTPIGDGEGFGAGLGLD